MHPERYKIIYEDEWLIVADKPSGMLVIPTPKAETNTLTDLINRDLDRRGIAANAYPCHRLDRETSGLIVYSKGKKAQKLMMEEFRKRNVKKVYTAFVHGAVKKSFDTIRKSIYNIRKRRKEAAETGYKVIERRRSFSVLDVEPVTGRTNQIRIHLMGMGHPIVGESVFAFRKDFAVRFKRVALHARSIAFVHPMTGRALKFASPLPEDMKAFLSEHK